MEVLRHIPDPIEIRRRNETNSDEREQCLWTYCQWFVDRSEGCHSFWKVDWDYKMPDPTSKTFWRIPHRTVFVLKLGHHYPRNKMQKYIAEWAGERAKLQSPRRNTGIHEVLTDDKDDLKVIADARLKLEKDAALSLPCIEKDDSRGEPQAVATSIDCSEGQSDSENAGVCGKVKRQHTDHIAEEGYVWSFHNGLVHKPDCIQEVMMIPEARAAVDTEWNKSKATPVWDVNKVRPKSEVIRQARKDGKTV